eukprot:scaffold638_cov168-Amphora_coffeaeformis.AAC.35
MQCLHQCPKAVVRQQCLLWRPGGRRVVVTANAISAILPRSFATTTSNDVWDRYRVFPPTADILHQIQQERQAVLHRIDPQLYQQVYQEIWQGQNESSIAQTHLDAHWAVGPSGKAVYRWSDGETTRRFECMRREYMSVNSTAKTLLNLPGGSSLPSAPCLSHDEQYLAHLLPNQDNGCSAVMISNTTDSGRTYSWQNLPPGIIQVEFGPRHAKGYDIFFLQSTTSDHRPYQIWKSVWSEDTAAAPPLPDLLWSVADDPTLYLHVQPTKGGEFVMVQAQSLDSNQVFLLGDDSTMRPVALPTKGRTVHVDVGANGEVFVLVKDAEKGHCLVESKVDKLPLVGDPFAQDSLSVSGFEITEIDLYRYWVVLYEVNNMDGTPRIRVVDRRTAGETWIVDMPPNAAVAQMFQPVHNAWYDASACRFQVDTPIHTAVVYEYNFVSRRLDCVTPNADPKDDDFEGERVAVSSHDGTMVPLSVIRRRGSIVDNNKKHIPVVLTAYGAYGRNVDLSYNPAWRPLLDRGYAIAWAHVRGGGERGTTWHTQGRREHKVNSALDYLACANALQQYLFGRPVRLIAKAYSAGGVAVAGAVNRQPNLFDQLVLTNAFLDVCATMRNPNLPLTEHEWDEYGDTKRDDLIRLYCPVQTAVGVREFPRTLLLAALQDEAVPYWNALVYAKALRRSLAPGAIYINVLVEDGVGHDLGDKLLHISALEVAFILSGDNEIKG